MEGTRVHAVRAGAVFSLPSVNRAGRLKPSGRMRSSTSKSSSLLITHDVPLKAIERWVRTPSVSPKEEVAKRAVDRRFHDVEVEF